MSRFAPEYDWGRGGNRRNSREPVRRRNERKGSPNKQKLDLEFTDDDKLIILRNQAGLSYFDRRAIATYHHEPRRAELVRLGVSPLEVVKAGMGLTYAEHAAMHFLRYELYNDRGDWVAAQGMTAQMEEVGTERYEELVCDEDLRQWLISEIVMRRKKWGLK